MQKKRLQKTANIRDRFENWQKWHVLKPGTPEHPGTLEHSGTTEHSGTPEHSRTSEQPKNPRTSAELKLTELFYFPIADHVENEMSV